VTFAAVLGFPFSAEVSGTTCQAASQARTRDGRHQRFGEPGCSALAGCHLCVIAISLQLGALLALARQLLLAAAECVCADKHRFGHASVSELAFVADGSTSRRGSMDRWSCLPTRCNRAQPSEHRWASLR